NHCVLPRAGPVASLGIRRPVWRRAGWKNKQTPLRCGWHRPALPPAQAHRLDWRSTAPTQSENPVLRLWDCPPPAPVLHARTSVFPARCDVRGMNGKKSRSAPRSVWKFPSGSTATMCLEKSAFGADFAPPVLAAAYDLRFGSASVSSVRPVLLRVYIGELMHAAFPPGKAARKKDSNR